MNSANDGFKTLKSLNKLRSAPELDSLESKFLKEELLTYMEIADWFTIGIMSPSSTLAISILREMELIFNWPKMILDNDISLDGPVFLKANQNTLDIHIRIEYGLGEGILLSCQYYEEKKDTDTFGPLPLNFFSENFNNELDSNANTNN